MDTTAIDHAAKVLKAATEAARRLHPELGLSFGYIGNMNYAPRSDDRRWSVFAKLSSRAGETACDVSWGSSSTTDLPALAVCAALGDLFDWTDRQAVLLADNRLFQVCPQGWLEAEKAHAAAWAGRTRLAAGL